MLINAYNLKSVYAWGETGIKTPLSMFSRFSYFRICLRALQMSPTGDFKNEISPQGLDDDFIRNI